MTSVPVVEARGLTKTYPKGVRGIEDVTFAVRRGEVFGFLGPNGAGKTTTMRVLLDLIRPTSGEARLFGLDSRSAASEVHARVGYLPGDAGLAERLTAREQLTYLGHLRHGVAKDAIEALAARFQLDLDRPIRALSRGNKQKVALVQALMHDPELLVLDEPTSGLDPLMQAEFNDLVRERAAAGCTVFLSSHLMNEVEALCDRVGIVREGRLVAVERVADLKRRAPRRLRATFSRPPRADALAGVANVRDVRVEGATLACVVVGDAGDAVRALAGPDLVDLQTHEPSLEDVFHEVYGGNGGA